MAYYVDIGTEMFIEVDKISEAREVAEHALEAARDFYRRMGWVPFWGRCLEIRREKANLRVGRHGNTTEGLNQIIVQATKTYEILYFNPHGEKS